MSYLEMRYGSHDYSELWFVCDCGYSSECTWPGWHRPGQGPSTFELMHGAICPSCKRHYRLLLQLQESIVQLGQEQCHLLAKEVHKVKEEPPTALHPSQGSKEMGGCQGEGG